MSSLVNFDRDLRFVRGPLQALLSNPGGSIGNPRFASDGIVHDKSSTFYFHNSVNFRSQEFGRSIFLRSSENNDIPQIIRIKGFAQAPAGDLSLWIFQPSSSILSVGSQAPLDSTLVCLKRIISPRPFEFDETVAYTATISGRAIGVGISIYGISSSTRLFAQLSVQHLGYKPPKYESAVR